MKKLLPLALYFAFLSTVLTAQNEVVLNIHHKLGDEAFTLNEMSTNHQGDHFNVSRLQYYISQISIIHDGGQVTDVEEYWILADAATPGNHILGNYDITEVEGLNLYVGVSKTYNHLDPTSYPSSHPLAPKFPEMHWGWAAGYRFACFEGKGGDQLNQKFELHGLGDDNYFKTEIPVSANVENNRVEINIDADYAGILQNIDVSKGVIVHGDYGDAKKSLENFRDYVFTASPTSASSSNLMSDVDFKIYPNPTQSGLININVQMNELEAFDMLVTDILGKKMDVVPSIPANQIQSYRFSQPGMYFIYLMHEGERLAVEKVVSK